MQLRCLILIHFGIAILASLWGSAACVEVSVAETPISKVIQLLEEMASRGTKDKEEEATRFSAFSQWCTDQTRIKTDEINEGTAKIEMLAAKIEKATVLIAALTSRIEELVEDVGRWKQDKKSASDVRSKEGVDYSATSADYSESLEALDGALQTLKSKAHNSPQAQEALLQVTGMKLLPISSKKALAAFLQQGQPNVEELPDKQLFYEAPEAYGYEFQSGGVIDVLERLKDQFAKKKYELDTEELKAQHAFEDIMQMLSDNTENANYEIQKKTKLRATTQGKKAALEGEKAETEREKAEDQTYLDGTTALCLQKKEDFQSRQKLRTEELAKLHEAIDIIKSETVSGTGQKHLPTLLQRRSNAKTASTLVQLAGVLSEESGKLLQTRVAAFLADRAKACNSRILALLSQQVATNPFVKVKKMIKDLISQLMQESTAEIEHKGWCDTELTTNKQTREQKTEAVEELTADKEDQTALIAELTQDIADLTKGMKDLAAAMAEATAERTATKEKNLATIADAKSAQEAVKQAIAILKDFYAKSAQATVLMQVAQSPGADAPETFDKAYTGLLPEGGNVVDFLEVILTDFVRLESETTTSEATDVAAYKKFSFESEKETALKDTIKGHRLEKKSDTETALASTEEELKLTQSQLDKAINYYEKLKPTCVDSGITYEERVRRREEEIQSLQEALKILMGTDLS